MSATTRRLGNGATETAVRNDAGELIAVITHPCAGAKWFLHRAGTPARRRAFRTLRAAVDWAVCPGNHGESCCGAPHLCDAALGAVCQHA